MAIPIPPKKQPITEAQKSFINGGAPQAAQEPIAHQEPASPPAPSQPTESANRAHRAVGKRGDRSAFKRLSVELTPEMHRSLKVAASREGTTVSAIILGLIRSAGF